MIKCRWALNALNDNFDLIGNEEEESNSEYFIQSRVDPTNEIVVVVVLVVVVVIVAAVWFETGQTGLMGLPAPFFNVIHWIVDPTVV